MNEKMVIIGAGGHGKVVADIARKCGYQEIIFLDDNSTAHKCMEYPIAGKYNNIYKFKEYDVFVAIGNADIREKILEKLANDKIKTPALVHPSAVVAKDVEIGIGTVIMAGAVINSGTVIGKGCIVNTSASIDHDNTIEDYVHVSVGAHTAGTVSIGKKTWIGIGAVVSNNVHIYSECIIGAGAVVVSDIIKKGTYIGVPARKI